MPDERLADLPLSGDLAGTELFYSDNGTKDVKVQADQIKKFALAGVGGTNSGVLTATGDTFSRRTITGTASEIAVANGDGAAGDPTVSLPDALIFTGKTVTGGTFNSPAINTPTGIVKGDVGLGNVDNTSDATKNAAVAAVTNKTFDAALNTVSNLTTAMFAANVVDTDGTLAANSDTRISSQKAIKTYADQLIAANDAMVFKGVVDCSTNPNYPAADRGHTYKVSVAGKIGGASGVNVEIGDILMCLTDGTVSGNQATVGTNWTITQANIDGAVVGPTSAVDGHVALFNGTTGKLIKDGGVLGTAAFLDTGSTANKVVQLDGSARLPAVDGSQLTNVVSSGVAIAIDVTSHSLVGDCLSVSDGAMTSGSAVLTSATGSFKSADVGKTVMVEGAGASGAALVTTIASFSSSTSVTLTASASTTVSSKKIYWGTDNSSPLSTLITSIGSIGRVLFFPPGNYLFNNLPNLTSLNSYTFLGAAPANNAGAGAATTFTQVGGSNFINLISSVNCTIDSIYFNFAQAAYSGFGIQITNAGAGDPACNSVRRCYFTGNSTSAGYIALDKSIETTIEKCNFNGGSYHIGGMSSTGYANVVKVCDCQFLSSQFEPIQALGESWTFDGCTFEARSSGVAGAILTDTNRRFKGLSIRGCWFGDVTLNGGTWLTLWGKGVLIAGNQMGANSTTSNLAISLNNVKGFSITGNNFETFSSVIDYTTATPQGGLISGNAYHNVTNFETGTANKDTASVVNTGNVNSGF